LVEDLIKNRRRRIQLIVLNSVSIIIRMMAPKVVEKKKELKKWKPTSGKIS